MIFGDDDWVAQTLARRYDWPGADLDDRIQEARVAMLEARRNYKPGLGKWTSYAWKAVKYHLIDCRERALYRRPQYVSPEPLDFMASRHNWNTTDELLDLRKAWRLLTPVEADHLSKFVSGFSYAEISDSKHVDNRIYYGRKKLRAA